MASRGVHSLYGRRLAARVRSRDLINMTAERRMFMLEGRSIGADLIRASLEQVRDDNDVFVPCWRVAYTLLSGRHRNGPLQLCAICVVIALQQSCQSR
jgi:hypothetical protein